MRELQIFQAMLRREREQFSLSEEKRKNMWKVIVEILKERTQDDRRQQNELQ